WNTPFPTGRSKWWWARSSTALPPVSSTRSRNAPRPAMETEVVRRRAGTPSTAKAALPDAAGRHAEPPHGTGRVSVVYARRGHAWRTELTVAAGTDVGTVFRLSGFAQAFPDYPSQDPAVGVFGRRCRLDEIVSEGDRIEI